MAAFAVYAAAGPARARRWGHERAPNSESPTEPKLVVPKAPATPLAKFPNKVSLIPSILFLNALAAGTISVWTIFEIAG